MSSLISRRALFPALAAAPATLGAATVHAGQQSPDAELLGLLDQFTKAEARYREIEAETARLGREWAVLYPKRPEALYARKGDFEMLLHYSGKDEQGRRYFTIRDVDALRSTPLTRSEFIGTQEQWNALPMSEEPLTEVQKAEWDALYTDVRWPEAQARADEIVAAYDAWKAEKDRLAEVTGYNAADRAAQEAHIVVASIARQIGEAPARTIDGLVAKATALAFINPDFVTECEDLTEGMDVRLSGQIIRGLLALSRRA